MDEKSARSNVIIITVSVLLVITIVTGAILAFSGRNTSKTDAPAPSKNIEISQPSEKSRLLYRYKGTSSDNRNKLTKLIYDLDFANFEINSIENENSLLTINYAVDSRTKYRFMNDYSKNFNQTGAVLFSLCPSLDNIVMTVSDGYGEFYSYAISRTSLCTSENMKKFTAKYINSAAENETTFDEFIKNVDLIKSEDYDNSYLKQIYSNLSDDIQINENSRTYFKKRLTQDVCLALEPLELNLSPYKNAEAEIIFYSGEDYKTHEGKNFVFIFVDKNLSLYDAVSSPEIYEKTIAELNK